MEMANRFYSKIINTFALVIILHSCAGTKIDEAAFESSEEESKRVLDDSYVVEEQKKLRDYQPDKVKLKTISSKSKKLNPKPFSTTKNTNGKKVSNTTVPNKTLQSQTAEWKDQDLKSSQLWKLFSSDYIKANEKHVLLASFTGMNVATLSIEVKPHVRYQSKEVFHFQAKAQTADFYKWIYSLNDVVDSLVDKDHFVSWKYSLMQKEKNKEIEDIQFYDRNLLSTFSMYKKHKDKKTEEEKLQSEIPFYGQDYFSSLFFIRGLPLKDKDHYVFPTTTKAKTWLMSLQVLAREKIKISIGEFKAIKLELITKYTGDLAKKGPITLWVTDDNLHTLLKASAEVKIGSVKLELAEYYQDDKLIYGDK